ncbi:hypothetical protein ACIP98_21245 [Streptomyces sp. NPDC088354]|uniref:hypothetical protein n=1 Tax=Streptomyces sp. NPDC088354 TaxID=3365856 RepID=UPI00381FF40F
MTTTEAVTAHLAFTSGPTVELADAETTDLGPDFYGWAHHQLAGWLTAYDPDRCPSGTDQVQSATGQGIDVSALAETNVEVSTRRMLGGPHSGIHMIITWRGRHHPDQDQNAAADRELVLAGPGIGAVEVVTTLRTPPEPLPGCACTGTDVRYFLELNGSEPVLRHAACGGEVDTAWPSGDTLFMGPIPVTAEVVQEPEDSHIGLTVGFPPADEHPETLVFAALAREVEEWGHDATPAAIVAAAQSAIQPVIDALRIEAAQPLGFRLLGRLDAAAAEAAAEEHRLDSCDCVEPEGPYLFEVDADSISVVHQACGKAPSDDAWIDDCHFGPLPVTVRWESDCTGGHQGACDCHWWPVYSPVPSSTVQAEQVHKMRELAGILVHRREPMEGRALADLMTRWLDEVKGASPWVRLVDGLNALAEADMPYHFEPAGVISNPLGPQVVEFDAARLRWVLRFH